MTISNFSRGLVLSRAAFLRLMGAAGLTLATAGHVSATPPTPLMRTRPIPKSGEALPVIGLGTARTFDIGSGAAERAQRRAVLQQLFKFGGRVIDSSPMYGSADEVVGDLIDGLGARDKTFIATKVWTRGRESGIRQMEESMAKLRTRRIDLMQVHNLVDWHTQLKTLRDWKAAGRIRYIGITHYTTGALADLADVIQAEPLDFVQLAYSIGVRDAEDWLLPLAADKGVAVLVNRPYENGALFRRVRGRTLPAWAREFDCMSWGQFFLKYIIAHPAVTCAIPATRKPNPMTDNAGAGIGRLPNAAQRRRMVALVEGV